MKSTPSLRPLEGESELDYVSRQLRDDCLTELIELSAEDYNKFVEILVSVREPSKELIEAAKKFDEEGFNG